MSGMILTKIVKLGKKWQRYCHNKTVIFLAVKRLKLRLSFHKIVQLRKTR